MHKLMHFEHTKYMKEIEQIDKLVEELSFAEKEILEEHTKKTAQQLNHFLNLKKKKLYLKKKVKQNQLEKIKEEIKNKY